MPMIHPFVAMNPDNIAARIRKATPVEWEGLTIALGDVPNETRDDVVRILHADAERAAHAAGYFTESLQGSRSHRRSVKRANRLVSIVRKALGYTYPDSPVNF